MKTNRYIKNPLIIATTTAIVFQFTNFGFFFGLIVGAAIGLGLQFYSDYKTRQIKKDTTEEDFNPFRQENLILFYNYQQSFKLCLDSISVLDNAKIVSEDYSSGVIEIKIGTFWSSVRNTITFKVIKLTDISTQVEVYVEPLVKTAQFDYGEGLKIIKTLEEFFQTQNGRVNHNILEGKTEIPINPVNNDKVKNINK